VQPSSGAPSIDSEIALLALAVEAPDEELPRAAPLALLSELPGRRPREKKAEGEREKEQPVVVAPPPTRDFFTDRRDRTAGHRFRFTGPVGPVTG